jgi:hypothetical protein
MDLLPKDVRLIFETYLDLPCLELVLKRWPYEFYGKNKKKLKWETHVKKQLAEKKRQCIQMWNYHTDSPDLLRPIGMMHNTTLGNIRRLEAAGFRWQEDVYCWFIDGRNALDQMVPGYHPEKGRVQYWRHETSSRQSGSTMLMWDVMDPNTKKVKRKRIQVHKYFQDQGI